MVNDGKIVNYAGMVRGRSQRVIKLELFENNGFIDYRLNEKIAEVSSILQGLEQGNARLGLIQVKDLRFQNQILVVQSAWSNLTETIEALQNNEIGSQALVEESEDFWELTNQLVLAAEDYATENVQDLKRLQMLLFIANLVILGIILSITHNISQRFKRAISLMASSTTEIATTVEEQERVATQQASAVNETTTTIDELEVSSRKTAAQAESTEASAREALNLTQNGQETVNSTLATMSELKENVGRIAQQITHLSEQTDRIGNISSLVENLANQTNMLALNAAVEAVRAGEQGKGFGVVATEIRKLTDKSKKFAVQIKDLVQDVQMAIASTVNTTYEGTKTVEQGVLVTQETTQVFQGISEAVNRVVQNNQQISLTIKQQTLAIDQVVQAINEIHQGANETANGVSQTRLGTQQLNEVTQNLKAVV